MNIKHHLDSSTLMSYSSGTLGEALSTVASAHLDICQSCRTELRYMNAIGFSLLQDIDPTDVKVIPISPDAMHKRSSASSLNRVKSAVNSKSLDKNFHKLVGSNFEELPWQWLAPGIRFQKIDLSEGSLGELRLLNISPGLKLPEHGHRGSELTMVLQGCYQDETGCYGPGDIADLDEDMVHRPRVISDEPCICLVGYEYPAKFNGLLNRAMQPFINF